MKRDNSALNLFFERVGKGVKPQAAFSYLQKNGNLEPGATDLSAEVVDQERKANISTNICSILLRRRPDRRHAITSLSDSHHPESSDLVDLSNWHLEGRKKRVYRALLTSIKVDGDAGIISCSMGFTELHSYDLLAVDFPGKNAITVEASENARFSWFFAKKSPVGGTFRSMGYGGAAKTALKLIWEANRSLALSNSPKIKFHSPLPILTERINRERRAIMLERKIASVL